MIDKKKMKQIHDKADEAMTIMTTLDKMRKRNMRYDVGSIVYLMDAYYGICEELKSLISEN